MFRLEVLGGLRLVATNGQVVEAQRRRLALLALLAAAGDRGLTRDQVMSCLWPETPEESARHALNQLLYGIRRSLSEGVVRGVDTLRLDPAVVDSDVARFAKALSAGEHQHAVAQYGGPFLNGFHLAEAPEFERWVERERARLAGAHADALERLAAEAERRGDAAAAVAWRRAHVELDPLDARRATALMRALATAGDSAGAIALGRTYEALVREELDAPADPALLALASEIRAGTEGRARTTSAQGAQRPSAEAPLAERERVRAMPEPEETADSSLGGSASRDRPGAGDDGNGGTSLTTRDVPPRRRRRLLFLSLAALALTMAFPGVRWLTRQRAHGSVPAEMPTPSIAVLPLRNLSADPSDAPLADGMTEELIARLSIVGDLRVIASTSVYAVKDRRMDVRRMAESLNVSHVLEGALQKSGRRLHLQLRLVGARDGATLWSEVYDREMGDVFAVQDDIARSVSRELGVRLARGASARRSGRRYTPSIEAYEWYLRAMDPTLRRTGDGARRAREYIDRAIATDSSFALAHARSAALYIGGSGNARDRAERAALKAIALDSSLPEGHAALGWVRITQRDWKRAETELQRAIALDPTASWPQEGMARLYLWTGRPAEQLEAARIGVEIDPLSVTALRELGLALAMNGRCDEAVESLRPLKKLASPAGLAGIIIGQCHAANGRWPEAIAEFRWSTQQSDAGMGIGFLGYALARAGQRDSARAILSDLLAGRKQSNGAFGIASVYAGLGEYEDAFRWLEQAVEENSVRPHLMGPMFDDLRRDPRFARVRRRLNL